MTDVFLKRRINPRSGRFIGGDTLRTVCDELLEREIGRVMRMERRSRKDAAFTNPDPMYGGDRSYEPMIAGGRRTPVRYE